nr:hypothetical protein [Alistipes sp.]
MTVRTALRVAPREEVRRLADEAVAFLVAQGASWLSWPAIPLRPPPSTSCAKIRPMPIVGMEPAVKPACLATRSGVVGYWLPNGASTASSSAARRPGTATA